MRRFIILFCCLVPLLLSGQNGKKLTQDPALRTGVLKNGMTYYIRYNNYPPGYVDFQIFHAVGAMQEEDNQNGLAHFLEHLAFNGLQHFPGKTLMNYMEKIGVKFGANLNAATSLDYTQYMINSVPVSREGILDTCLLVLHDWSGSILCEQDEIDAERGIIQQERRSRGGAPYRISQLVSPAVYKGSKYAVRNVIGSEAVIDTFKREELMTFYKKWYYPQLQAISIVGDVDVDKTEQKVIALFSAIPGPGKPLERERHLIPDNDELIYVACTDKEAVDNSVEIIFKHPAVPDSLNCIDTYYMLGYKKYLVTVLMNNRMNDKFRDGDYCAKSIDFSYSRLGGDKDVFSMSAGAKSGSGNIKKTFEMLLEEGERFVRYGFTPGEIERVKRMALRSIESTLSGKDKRSNNSFTKQHSANFLSGQPVLALEDYCNLLKRTLEEFSLAEANALVKSFFINKNQIAVFTANSAYEKEIPAEQVVKKALNERGLIAVEPFTDTALPASLIQDAPVPGKIISGKNLKYNIREWILSNGAKVYVLPTTLKKDDIQFACFRWGGHSLLSDADFASARLMTSAVTCSGVGDFTATQLKQMLSGKIVYVTPVLGEFYHGLDCATTPADLEAMLQVVYLHFTAPRFDPESFAIYKNKMKENLTVRTSNPFSALMDSVTLIRGNYHPRASNLILNPGEVDQVSLERIKELYPVFFGNPADFKWFITGAVDTVSLRPLLEKYIGSLRGNGGELMWKDVNKRPPQGRYVSDFSKKMETPKSTTFIEYTSLNCGYSYRLSTAMRLIQGILEIRFNELIREEKSGTYSVDIEGSLSRLPVPVMHLIVSFESAPGRMDELRKAVFEEMKKIAEQGVDPKALEKTREYMLKIYKENQLSNNYWQSIMLDYIRNGQDNQDGSLEILNSITAEEIQTIIRQLVNESNVADITMRGY